VVLPSASDVLIVQSVSVTVFISFGTLSFSYY